MAVIGACALHGASFCLKQPSNLCCQLQSKPQGKYSMPTKLSGVLQKESTSKHSKSELFLQPSARTLRYEAKLS